MPDKDLICFDSRGWCVVHLRPHSDVVQMTSNLADESTARHYMEMVENDGGHVFVCVPAGVLVAALMHIRPESRRPAV